MLVMMNASGFPAACWILTAVFKNHHTIHKIQRCFWWAGTHLLRPCISNSSSSHPMKNLRQNMAVLESLGDGNEFNSWTMLDILCNHKSLDLSY